MFHFERFHAALQFAGDRGVLGRHLAFDVIDEGAKLGLHGGAALFQGGHFVTQTAQQTFKLFATHGARSDRVPVSSIGQRGAVLMAPLRRIAIPPRP